MKAQLLFDDLKGVMNSFYDDETLLIRAILRIHNKGKPIDCDPMYNQGAFYQNSDFSIEKPKYRFDIKPYKDCEIGDATQSTNFGKHLTMCYFRPSVYVRNTRKN